MFSGLSTAALAESHELRMMELGIGSSLVYEASDGEITNKSLVGREGKNFVTEIREGASTDGALQKVVVVDSKGQRVRQDANGVTFRYVPNFCYRTVGRCTFKFYNDNTGNSARLERFTHREGPNRFSYELYVQGRAGSELVEKGWYETGEYGVVSEYYYAGSSTSKTGKLIEIHLP